MGAAREPCEKNGSAGRGEYKGAEMVPAQSQMVTSSKVRIQSPPYLDPHHIKHGIAMGPPVGPGHGILLAGHIVWKAFACVQDADKALLA